MGQSNSSEIINQKCENYSDFADDSFSSSSSSSLYDPINEGLHNPDSGGLRLVFRAFFSVLAFFGLIANFVVFLVTSQNERKQKPSSIYLLLLSVADIIFLSCMMFTSYFDNSFNYPFPNGFCKFQAVLDTASQNMSSLLLAGIAWDRLLLLFCPQRRTNIFAWVFAAGALALSIFAASPYGYSHRLKSC